MGKVSVYDVVIIGGGFYGCVLALLFKKSKKKVCIVEKEDDLLLKASYKNQARIHNGYHYPRHFITGLRSHANYGKFKVDFKEAVFDNFKQYYAIAATSSKTTPGQFVRFCKHIGSFVKPAPHSVKQFFNSRLVEEVFEVDECVFDASVLRKILKIQLRREGVDVLNGVEIVRVDTSKGKVVCYKRSGGTLVAPTVFNCTYSGINKIIQNSGFPLLPLKHEFIEMPIIKVPEELRNMSVTIMDGSFFGFLPFPDKKTHSLWHVRYAFRHNWSDPKEETLDEYLKELSRSSNYNFMIKDAARFIPILKESIYKESLFETKTVLQASEENDGRPILYKKDYGIKGFHVVMGGKIDNIYDIFEEINE